MVIKDKAGRIIYHDDERTVLRSLISCIEQRRPLNGASLRRAKLSGGGLDGLKAPGSDFWGVHAVSADFAGADLSESDMRGGNFENACFAFADLRGCDFSGAFLKNVLWEGAQIDGAVFSCPSLFSSDLNRIESCRGAIFRLRGEQDIALSKPLVTIHGLSRMLVLGLNWGIFGDRLVGGEANSLTDMDELAMLQSMIESCRKGAAANCSET